MLKAKYHQNRTLGKLANMKNMRMRDLQSRKKDFVHYRQTHSYMKLANEKKEKKIPGDHIRSLFFAISYISIQGKVIEN